MKKSEYWRTDAFKLWCLRRLLRVPWTAKSSDLQVLKKINPEYSLESLMLKLKLQYFGHLIGRDDSLEKTLLLGRIEGKRRRGWQKTKRWDNIINWMDVSLSKLWEIREDRGAPRAVVHGVTKSQTQLSNWTTTTWGPKVKSSQSTCVQFFTPSLTNCVPLCPWASGSRNGSESLT